MKATFENSVNVLVKAYLNDTLQHSNCNACAVGNLIASAMNLQYRVRDAIEKGVCYPEGFLCWQGDIRPDWFNNVMIPTGEDHQQIQSTGYTPKQIVEIEAAFEFRSIPLHLRQDDPDGYKGLMAVVDVLAEIHNISLEQKSVAKAMFVKTNPIEP